LEYFMDSTVMPDVPVLVALRLSEEQACAGYLTARRAMVRLARWAASLGQLVAEQPARRDYRTAWDLALAAYRDAALRTRLAWQCWQRAQHRCDAVWTATEGRQVPQPRSTADHAA
jgi:hypothetical protein